jgi:hypothetical protein
MSRQGRKRDLKDRFRPLAELKSERNFMRYDIPILIMLCGFMPSAAIHAATTENSMPPVRGWSAIQWEMTRGQIEKITGNPVKPLDREYESAGIVRFYGYPAQLLVVFDRAGGLTEFDFDVLANSHADAARLLHEIHGYLVADLGQPTRDGIDWIHRNGDEAFNTMWCSRTWTVFIAVGGSRVTPNVAIVQYIHRDTCRDTHR